jgi:hypothetical protein
MNKGRVGEERRGKETDRCPLTLIPAARSSSLEVELTGNLQRSFL